MKTSGSNENTVPNSQNLAKERKTETEVQEKNAFIVKKMKILILSASMVEILTY